MEGSVAASIKMIKIKKIKKKKGFTPLEVLGRKILLKIFMHHDKKKEDKQTSPVLGKAFISKGKLLTGFTLLELMTTIAMISILSVIFVAGYRSGDKTFRLQRAANKLASDIRKAGELALSGKDSRNSCPGATGYGLYAEKNQVFYILYADKNGNDGYDSSDCPIETINLEKGVKISDVDTGTGADKASINFRPPDPKIDIKWLSGSVSSLKITLALQDNLAKIKAVIVNQSGLIDID